MSLHIEVFKVKTFLSRLIVFASSTKVVFHIAFLSLSSMKDDREQKYSLVKKTLCSLQSDCAQKEIRHVVRHVTHTIVIFMIFSTTLHNGYLNGFQKQIKII